MIVDITNEVLTNIKNTITPVLVLSDYPEVTTVFPCVIVEDKSNNDYSQTVDTSGVHHNDCLIEINIYSNSQDKKSEVKDLRDKIDAIMSGQYRMTRTFGGQVPNFSDSNIYRYALRYTFLVDKNKTIYRR